MMATRLVVNAIKSNVVIGTPDETQKQVWDAG
jgi:hypothetical protein